MVLTWSENVKTRWRNLCMWNVRPKRFYVIEKLDFILASRVKLHLSFWDVVKYLDAIFIQKYTRLDFPWGMRARRENSWHMRKLYHFENNCSTLLWFDHPHPLAPYTTIIIIYIALLTATYNVEMCGSNLFMNDRKFQH